MRRSPYAVPLADLDAQVALADQTTEQAAPRTAHLPGEPALWGLTAVPVADGAGGDADGD